MHKIIFIFTLLLTTPTLSAATPTYHLHIDRAHKQLYVLNADDAVVWQAPCGIGRGGLRVKKSMADAVTPTGEFVVDIILDEKSALFQNMNRIFNHAYGSAYIGLDSKTAITGPKLIPYRDGTQYWFSIALHGTPDPANIGQAKSGGCIHLSAESLAHLLGDGIVKIGTRVTIADGGPQ